MSNAGSRRGVLTDGDVRRTLERGLDVRDTSRYAPCSIHRAPTSGASSRSALRTQARALERPREVPREVVEAHVRRVQRRQRRALARVEGDGAVAGPEGLAQLRGLRLAPAEAREELVEA